jgi:hypothetical protein
MLGKFAFGALQNFLEHADEGADKLRVGRRHCLLMYEQFGHLPGLCWCIDADDFAFVTHFDLGRGDGALAVELDGKGALGTSGVGIRVAEFFDAA